MRKRNAIRLAAVVAAIMCGSLAFRSASVVWSVGPLATVGGGIVDVHTWAFAAVAVLLLIGAIVVRPDPKKP